MISQETKQYDDFLFLLTLRYIMLGPFFFNQDNCSMNMGYCFIKLVTVYKLGMCISAAKV